MAHRHVEILIGRLVTDEAFRAAFLRDPRGTLLSFVEAGHDLTEVEIDALLTIGSEVWAEITNRIDPRLRKASLR